ncbi:MAG: hydrolase [Candidatus Saccharibacteria bacterium]|nr:hydrolase [Candidatus Saccharibacteria bacterium]
MGQASRAIIIENDKVLVMYRNKQGSQYYTLVGGRVAEGETPEDALVREIMEETGLSITTAQLVFVEYHQPPYNEQYIYLCEVAPHADVALDDASEEAQLNKLTVNIHKPQWIDKKAFAKIAFRTPQLQEAIVKAMKKGFPSDAIRL